MTVVRVGNAIYLLTSGGESDYSQPRCVDARVEQHEDEVYRFVDPPPTFAAVGASLLTPLRRRISPVQGCRART